jgi:hypothetical protein
MVLVAAVFTRYDGWVMAFLAWVAIGVTLARRGELRSRAFWIAGALVVAAPVVWFTYNAVVFGDWLDFMRGPYSARAIELRTATPGSGPPHPGWHNPWVSLEFFVKAAEMDSAAAAWGNRLLVLSVLGTAWAWLTARRRAFSWSMLLWLPVPFYAYSVAYGSVPIFLPPWWPHSWYNTRYGMEMLPIFALSLAFMVGVIADWIARLKPSVAPWIPAVVALLIVADSTVLLRAKPLVLDEAIANSRSRIQFEVAYANALAALPPKSMILAYTSEHAGAFQRAGIALKRTINESDYYEWAPALKNPAQAADYVIATDGDRVAQAVAAKPDSLTLINIVCSTGQPCARFYRSDRHVSSGSITQK